MAEAAKHQDHVGASECLTASPPGTSIVHRGNPKGGQRTLAFVPVSEAEVPSIRQAAAMCNVTPPVIRRWLSLGLISGPPWTLQQLHEVRDMTDPQGRRRGPQAAHGTLTCWLEGCDCDGCREA